MRRVPDTEAHGRTHNSAATVAVLPEAEEAEISIKDDDLKIERVRASGPGGQNVNKVSSAIRVTHEPSGIVVSCQDEQSQHKNLAKATRVLRSRLYERQQQRLRAERDNLRRGQVGSGDRSEKIRTYKWDDHSVTDHRIGLKVHNLHDVMDGHLDEIVQSLIDHEREKRLAAL